MSNRRHIYIDDHIWEKWSAHCKALEISASGGIRELVLGIIDPIREDQATKAEAGYSVYAPIPAVKEKPC